MIRLMISAGRGPAECRLAVSGLAAELTREARDQGLGVTVLDLEEAPHGPSSIVLGIAGRNEKAFAASWQGTAQWICKSPLRPNSRRKNWFVSATVLPDTEKTSLDIQEGDLKWETCRSSGAGGQHVNRTESAVRLVHLPSGLAIRCESERSQHRNRAIALQRLKFALATARAAEERQSDQDQWQEHNVLQRGCAARTYEGPKFRRKA